MWIRLTLALTGTPILVNLDRLSAILPYKRSNGITIIEVCGEGESGHIVRESFDEIQARISALIIPA